MEIAGTVNLMPAPRWFDEPLNEPSVFDSTLSANREVDRIPQGTFVGSSEWKLALDLGVDLEYTDKYVIATNSWIDEYGHGDTKQSAIEDLLVSLVDFYESLQQQQRESQLAEELCDALSKLNILLFRGK